MSNFLTTNNSSFLAAGRLQSPKCTARAWKGGKGPCPPGPGDGLLGTLAMFMQPTHSCPEAGEELAAPPRQPDLDADHLSPPCTNS